MRLVVVGFANSVHTARYLQLLSGSGWDVHLFDSLVSATPHPELPPVTLHATDPGSAPEGVRVVPASPSDGSFAARVQHLARVVDAVRPDVVHSHEIQHGGALVDGLRRSRPDLRRIPWLLTNWGSDILWWGRVPTTVPRIRSVVSNCDYYSAECHRDVALARAFGFRGQVVGVWPVAGGIDIERTEALRTPGATSLRRTLAVKGSVNHVGRGRVAFDAVARCADLLHGWEVATYQLDSTLGDEVDRLASMHGFVHRRMSDVGASTSPHDEMLRMHGRSRVSLGLNVTDALSTSFIEALAMGSFPVQSSSSCGNELTRHGQGALFVPAEDAGAVASALRRALSDDRLVDEAATMNRHVVAQNLDRRRTRARVLDAYERILIDHGGNHL